MIDRVATAQRHEPAGGWRTVAAIGSAMLLSAIVWGLVTFFDLR